MDKKTLSNIKSILYHALIVTLSYLIPVFLATIIAIPFMAAYSIMIPMMVFMWSWKSYVLLLIVAVAFRNSIERKIIISCVSCTFIAYFSFYYFSPFLVRSFIGYDTIGVNTENMIKSALFILGFPLIYSALSMFIYFLFLRRKDRKQKAIENIS